MDSQNPRTPPPFKRLWISLDPEQKRELAKKTGVAYSHLSQLAHGHRRADINTLVKICNADDRVKARDLRPDLPE